jgi:hypothetical protein
MILNALGSKLPPCTGGITLPSRATSSAWRRVCVLAKIDANWGRAVAGLNKALRAKLAGARPDAMPDAKFFHGRGCHALNHFSCRVGECAWVAAHAIFGGGATNSVVEAAHRRADRSCVTERPRRRSSISLATAAK